MSSLTWHVVVRDPDRASSWYASVLGAELLHDAFWGERTGQFIDPFGHRWALDQHLRDVPHDEVVRLAAEAFPAEEEG